MPHGGHGHAHSHAAPGSGDGRLLAAVAINLLLTAAQVVGGLMSGSLSLIADALHNFNDAASLLLALLARRIGRRPADEKRTFGYRRAETIGALISLTALILVGVYLLYEAALRYFQPEPIAGWTVIWVAGIALVIDIATAWLTYSMSAGNLNIRAAFLHNVSDALASVAVIVAGTVILLWQWYLVDLIATVVIAAYVLYQGVGSLKEAIRMLMDSAPRDLDVGEIAAAMAAVEGVARVHHLHVWEIDEGTPALEAHIVPTVYDLARLAATKARLTQMLGERFELGHITLDFELAERSAAASEPLIAPH